MLVLIIGFFLKIERFSISKILIIIILCIGIVLTSYGELDLSLSGLLLSVFALIAASARLILMQILISNKSSEMEEDYDISSPSPTEPPFTISSPLGFSLQYETRRRDSRIHPLLTLAYFAPISALSLFIPWCAVEAPSLFASAFMERKGELFGYLLIGVFLAISLNLVEILIMEASSALTLCVSGIIKLLIIIGLNSVFFNYTFTSYNISGIVLAIVGVIAYNYIRFKDVIKAQLPFEKVRHETEDAFNY